MAKGFQICDIKNIDCDVLVICSTYNQKEYLASALEGFVSQQTSFPFLVLVHDDASTDGTPEIIRDYELRYPSLIKGIYETQNQYQLGKYFWYLDYLKNSRAHYIALCEGDDYWISPYKLESQYQKLSNDHSLAYCFTNAVKIDAATGESRGRMLPFFPSEAQILSKEILNTVDLLKLAFIPTASFFSRRDAWLKQPELPKEAFQGDRAHQIYLSLSGNAAYLDEVTCAYRVNNKQSAMGNWAASRQKAVSTLSSYITLYKCFDRYTNEKFHDNVSYAINEKIYESMFLTGDRFALNPTAAIAVARSRGRSAVLKYILLMISPKLYQRVRNRSWKSQGKVSANG